MTFFEFPLPGVPTVLRVVILSKKPKFEMEQVKILKNGENLSMETPPEEHFPFCYFFRILTPRGTSCVKGAKILGKKIEIAKVKISKFRLDKNVGGIEEALRFEFRHDPLRNGRDLAGRRTDRRTDATPNFPDPHMPKILHGTQRQEEPPVFDTHSPRYARGMD